MVSNLLARVTAAAAKLLLVLAFTPPIILSDLTLLSIEYLTRLRAPWSKRIALTVGFAASFWIFQYRVGLCEVAPAYAGVSFPSRADPDAPAIIELPVVIVWSLSSLASSVLLSLFSLLLSACLLSLYCLVLAWSHPGWTCLLLLFLVVLAD
jgi:hypothetical protein